MSLPRRMKERREQDQDREREMNVRKHDPLTDDFGGVRYSRDDIEALEYDKVRRFWRGRKRK